MRILNKGNVVKVISALGKKIHIYPGLEEDVPDEIYYKVQKRIDKEIDLKTISASKTAVKPSIKKYTNEELYKMNKDAQIKLLNRYGITKIPQYEEGRVKAILKLQE